MGPGAVTGMSRGRLYPLPNPPLPPYPPLDPPNPFDDPYDEPPYPLLELLPPGRPDPELYTGREDEDEELP